MVLTGCDNLTGGDNKTEEFREVPNDLFEDPNDLKDPNGLIEDPSQPEVLGDFKFDLTGAKAILAVDPSSPSSSVAARAAIELADDILVKVLDDDTVASIADFSRFGWAPKIRFIAHTPVEGKKDIYICFESDLYYWNPTFNEQGYQNGGETVYLGSLLHVKEDGSIISILKQEGDSYTHISQNSDNDPVVFDKNGNMYFIAYEGSSSGSTNSIYSYNPSTGYRENLTGPRSNTYYEKFVLAQDGSLILVQASASGNNYLRAIPTNNPDNYANLYYTSAGTGGGWVSSFALSPDAKKVYLSGTVTRDEITYTGLIQADISDLRNVKWTHLFNDRGGQSYYGLFASEYGHKWKTDFLDESGTPKYDDILEYFTDLADRIGIEFWYNGKADRAALESLTPDEIRDIFYYSSELSQFMASYYRDKTTLASVTVPYQWIGSGLGVAEYGPTYKWGEVYYTGGSPDYDKIMAFLYDIAKSDNIEFRFNNKTDREALASLSQADLQDFYNGSYNNGGEAITDYCFRIGSTTPITTAGNGYQYFASINKLVINRNGSVWGLMSLSTGMSSKMIFCQLVDASGKRDYYVPSIFTDKEVAPSMIQLAEPYIYYAAEVNPNDPGFQRVYRFSVTSSETKDDLFNGMVNRNPDRIELESYTLSNDYLYFSGYSGRDNITGKINLTTHRYTEINFGAKVNAVMSY
jgi:hypothetical protein